MSTERLRVLVRARCAAQARVLRIGTNPNRSKRLLIPLLTGDAGQTRVLRERGEQESDLAQAWWRLPPRTLLTLEDGRRCLLLYNGQPGGSAGPDVRDAVLRWLSEIPEDETQVVGDVEFHLRASDWFAHGHHTDPRYNQVILHVVFYPDSKGPTRRQDGRLVPTCSLLDFPQSPQYTSGWPCQQTPLCASEITTTLIYAGLQRFAEKSQNLHRELVEMHATGQTMTRNVEQATLWAGEPETGSQRSLANLQLSEQGSQPHFNVYDTCLLAALAEGLGYGRDRAFFRAVGLRLVGLSAHLPEPLGHTQFPAPLDARRLRTLYTLVTRWQAVGAWNTLSQELRQTERDVKATAAALRAALHPLSPARADILVVNIVLPFAAAIAELENDTPLAARAQQIFLAYPGLVSNRITRRMSTQLQLPNEPGQACLQQGLHHIHAHTCRAKACQDCLCGGQRL